MYMVTCIVIVYASSIYYVLICVFIGWMLQQNTDCDESDDEMVAGVQRPVTEDVVDKRGGKVCMNIC